MRREDTPARERERERERRGEGGGGGGEREREREREREMRREDTPVRTVSASQAVVRALPSGTTSKHPPSDR